MSLSAVSNPLNKPLPITQSVRGNAQGHSYLMGNVAIRVEEMVPQNPRGWQKEIGEEMKGEKKEEEKKVTDTQQSRKFHE